MPMPIPTAIERQAVVEHPRQHVARRGAERHADADLARAPRHQVRLDTVDADQREQHCDARRARRRRWRRSRPSSARAPARDGRRKRLHRQDREVAGRWRGSRGPRSRARRPPRPRRRWCAGARSCARGSCRRTADRSSVVATRDRTARAARRARRRRSRPSFPSRPRAASRPASARPITSPSARSRRASGSSTMATALPPSRQRRSPASPTVKSRPRSIARPMVSK